MQHSEIFVGDTGTAIELQTGAELAGAVELLIAAKKPDGTVVEWTAQADGTLLRYITQAEDLDMDGVWKLQSIVETASGRWRGRTAELKVLEPFN